MAGAFRAYLHNFIFERMDKEKKGYVTGDDIINELNNIRGGFNQSKVGKVTHYILNKGSQWTWDAILKSNLIWYLDAVFEPHGNLLTGLEPQITKQVKLKDSCSQPRAPVLLIPGLAGTILRNNNDSSQQYWVNLPSVASASYEANLQVTYFNSELKSVKSVAFVPGKTGVRDLGKNDPNNPYIDFPGFANLIDSLDADAVDASSYDWRLIPDPTTINAWAADVTQRLKNLYETNNNTKVYILAHSMGNYLTLWYLQNKDFEDSVNDYVAGYIAVSSPWGGTAAAIDALVKGQTKVVTVSHLLLNYFPGISWGVPKEFVFGADTIVSYNQQTFKSADIGQFLLSYSGTQAGSGQIYKDIIEPFPYPDFTLAGKPTVPIWNLTASYAPSIVSLSYNSTTETWNASYETTSPVIGDGTVPYVSLHGVDTLWSIPAGNIQQFTDCNHTTILSDTDFINAVGEILCPDTK